MSAPEPAWTVDTLLYVRPDGAGHTTITELSGHETYGGPISARDRAILRALLELALHRLGNREDTW